MAETTGEGLLLRDPAGTYYLLTPEILERVAIPAEQAEALIATLGDDVTGMAVINHEEQYKAPRLQTQNAPVPSPAFQLWPGVLAGGLHTGGVNY